ncbi:hypothetical protein T07_12882 [Trichinella nelsoni]|uniref:Uncharacterized protein n=1 Tax=Trichinella nelsoni TaxID=6336 RepID=A0A0V0SJM8_9BILA|nr:hypothetical protein T07_12882 [Trichinella nelsoni]
MSSKLKIILLKVPTVNAVGSHNWMLVIQKWYWQAIYHREKLNFHSLYQNRETVYGDSKQITSAQRIMNSLQISFGKAFMRCTKCGKEWFFRETCLEMEMKTMKCRLLRSYSFLVLSNTQQLCQAYYWNTDFIIMWDSLFVAFQISTRRVLIQVLFLRFGWNHMHSKKRTTCKGNLPQASPKAMPQGIKNLHIPPRLRLRHFIAQYLPSRRLYANFLCPQAMPQAFSQNFRNSCPQIPLQL